jgi:AraC-like DNA-binding protein
VETAKTEIHAQDILFTDDVHQAFHLYADYYLHLFIRQGEVEFSIAERRHRAGRGCGVILIEGKPISDVKTSHDFQADILLISRSYLWMYMPRITFHIKGLTFYYDHPLMQMNDEQMEQCLLDLDDIRRRIKQKSHIYHTETLRRAIDNFSYDIFDIYTRCNNERETKGGQEALVTQEFINLLKTHVQHMRTVAFYADKLFVTPKYLSRVCMQSTGHNASYWIAQFAVAQMLEVLNNSQQTLTEISQAFHFQSLSHFTRFIKKHTGIPPSSYRKKSQMGTGTI